MMCGYPIPCPYHTVIIHISKDPPTVEIPATAEAAWVNRDRLADIAVAVKPRVKKKQRRRSGRKK